MNVYVTELEKWVESGLSTFEIWRLVAEIYFINNYLINWSFVKSWMVRRSVWFDFGFNNFSDIHLPMCCAELKFMFSKKATKIDKIFTVDLTLT